MTVTSPFYKNCSLLLSLQFECLHLLAWDPVVLLSLTSQLDKEPVSWRHQMMKILSLQQQCEQALKVLVLFPYSRWRRLWRTPQTPGTLPEDPPPTRLHIHAGCGRTSWRRRLCSRPLLDWRRGFRTVICTVNSDRTAFSVPHLYSDLC